MPNELKNTIKLNVLKFLTEDEKELQNIQADLRSNDEDIEAALSKWGLSGKLGYYPISSMGNPFNVTFKVRFKGDKIPVSWQGVTTNVEGEDKVLPFEALIWLDPKARDNAVNGKPQDTYKFKVVKLNDGNGLKEVKDNFIEFQGKELNVEDQRIKGVTKKGKRVSPMIPQLRTGRKYFVKWYSELTSQEDLGTPEGDDGEVNVPEEVASGKNRNEIFRQLINIYGGYKGGTVYGDGFLDADEARNYVKLQSAVSKGKTDKSKLKDFRDKAKRDKYSMMIANLRKSFPTSFMSKLSKAFPEFGIKYGKSEMTEDILREEDNVDKYKRWGIVFPSGVIGNDTIDNLDKNIVKFMKAVKAYFAVPIDYKGKKFSYDISYNEDKVKAYHDKFYGSKNESLVKKIVNVLLEEEGDVTEKGNMVVELIFSEIQIKGIKQGEERTDDSFDESISSIMKKGSVSLTLNDILIPEESINKISEAVKKKGVDSKEATSIINILKGDSKGDKIKIEHDKSSGKLNILLGVTPMGRNIFLNVPIKENGVDVQKTMLGLFKGYDLNNCGIAYAKPKDPLVESGIKAKVKIDR